jgi:hypothetical protein
MATLQADKIIKAIDDLSGNVSAVARKFQVSRTTLYKYISDHPTVKAALDEAREKMIDNVESTLYSKALAGDTTAMIFFLKTQGKSRGYVERQEVTGKDGETLRIEYINDWRNQATLPASGPDSD